MFVAYYRVSTKDQHLGIDAQRRDVERFAKGKVIAEYEEKESGKKNTRIELTKAIEHCAREKATLIVAKLDRLSRDVVFIYKLMDSGVDFVCCDVPGANKFTIGILAVVAENEREMISQRTKAALQVLKAKGVKLGSPQNFTSETRKLGQQANKRNARTSAANRKATELIKRYRNEGMTYRAIASKLNDLELTTRRGKPFHAITVQRLQNRI